MTVILSRSNCLPILLLYFLRSQGHTYHHIAEIKGARVTSILVILRLADGKSSDLDPFSYP